MQNYFLCEQLGQTLSQRSWIELARLHVDSCFVCLLAIWNRQDIEQHDAIKPIEIWEHLHQLMSRDTPSFKQKVLKHQVLQPDEAPLLMEYLTKLLDEQLVDFIRVFLDCLRLILLIYVDESCEGCHDVVQSLLLVKFQRCYFAVLKKWTWSICRTINWFGVFPLIPKATSESKNRLKPWDLRRFFCWHVVFLPDVLFSWRWYVFHWILKTRYEKDLGDDFLAYRPEDCWCAMSSQVMSKLEFGKAKSTDPEMNWMNS